MAPGKVLRTPLLLLLAALTAARAAPCAEPPAAEPPAEAGAEAPPPPPPPPPAPPAPGDKPAAPTGSDAALREALRLLHAEVDALPRRGAGVPPSREEIVLRLRLAMVALALDGPAEALSALEPLGSGSSVDKFELRRLAVLGLANWSANRKDEARRDLAELLAGASASCRLALRSPVLVDRVHGYGRYDERAARTVRRGETVLAYVEVLNFRCRPAAGGEHLTALDVGLRFDELVTTVGAGGEKLPAAVPRREIPLLDRVRHRTRSPINDLHLVVRFQVPAELTVGSECDLRITVSDQGAPAAAPVPSGKEAPAGEAPAEPAAGAAPAPASGSDPASPAPPSASAILRLRIAG